MLDAFAIVLVWIAAIAFFNTIIGVFGLQPAIVGLALFVALACAAFARSQHVESRP